MKSKLLLFFIFFICDKSYATIHEDVLSNTYYIAEDVAGASDLIKRSCTCFLFKDQETVYLVSALHVFLGIEEDHFYIGSHDNDSVCLITKSDKEGNILWKNLPGKDIAILPITDEIIPTTTLDVSIIPDETQTNNLKSGDDLYTIGFPAVFDNFVLRRGPLSISKKQFYLDIPTFGGDSGSPVYNEKYIVGIRTATVKFPIISWLGQASSDYLQVGKMTPTFYIRQILKDLK